MAQSRSAGVLLHRFVEGTKRVEVLLVLPGGPYWRGRNGGSWQIPKGAIEPGETSLDAAVREVAEELGLLLDGVPQPLCVVRQAGGKWVEAFTILRDWNPEQLRSNETEIIWPPRSGQRMIIPEVAEARWFALSAAYDAMLASQRPMLDALQVMLGD